MKQELKICALLEISLPVRIWKTTFLNSPVISFCLDTVYYAGSVSAFLIKTSKLFIKKNGLMEL